MFVTDVTLTSTSTNISKSVCQKPLIPVEIYNSRFSSNCSPACLADDWGTESELVAVDASLIFTVVFTWTCCVITFITWAGVPQL